MSYGYDWMSTCSGLIAGQNGFPQSKPFAFEYMYISRRVDIIGPPVWKSTISACLSKSELVSWRLWQSEHQQRMLSPLHHHMLTPPRYLTAPSHTQNPSDIERDRDNCTLWMISMIKSLSYHKHS